MLKKLSNVLRPRSVEGALASFNVAIDNLLNVAVRLHREADDLLDEAGDLHMRADMLEDDAKIARADAGKAERVVTKIKNIIS